MVGYLCCFCVVFDHMLECQSMLRTIWKYYGRVFVLFLCCV